MSATNSTLLTQLLGQLLSESRLTNSVISPVYDPQENINNWLNQYDLNCKRLALTDDQKLTQIGKYLPAEISNWVSRTPSAATWGSLKVALINTYGIPLEKYKLLLRRPLESLRQGNLPSRRFSVMFESIVLEFDSTHALDAPTLRIIYLRVMSSVEKRFV
ncbi:uncharacterized protein EV154DRAFT_559385 [Mucor mucedo]|uniref:uncharacterized protein n=1 Tax=Mucor mucedo TaxID=29922 RepID=UPI0022210C11|nr:uncharacterized protein EV154DRAFT_559385 [Mucor mucedo]KAI7895282.1 hypothetical protein EV154DRAFT_559385 [Mucor mucedo]